MSYGTRPAVYAVLGILVSQFRNKRRRAEVLIPAACLFDTSRRPIVTTVGADVRPNFDWNARGPVGGMGYRVVPVQFLR
jgi:hypothetical protein